MKIIDIVNELKEYNQEIYSNLKEDFDIFIKVKIHQYNDTDFALEIIETVESYNSYEEENNEIYRIIIENKRITHIDLIDSIDIIGGLAITEKTKPHLQFILNMIGQYLELKGTEATEIYYHI